MSQGRYSYLDGVPFAINPIFLPENQKDDDNSLNEAQKIFYHDLSTASSILNFQYNFRSEKKVLVDKKVKKASKLRTSSLLNKHSSQQITQNNTIQIAQDVNYLNLNKFASKSLNSSYETKPNHESNLTNASALYNSSQSSILKPSTHLLEPTRTSTLPTIQTQDSSHDMFTLTSSLDPFNDCELKTINDLEELKSILHNHKIEQAEQPKVKGEELLDNFGLPKVSFVDLDFNSNKL